MNQVHCIRNSCIVLLSNLIVRCNCSENGTIPFLREELSLPISRTLNSKPGLLHTHCSIFFHSVYNFFLILINCGFNILLASLWLNKDWLIDFIQFFFLCIWSIWSTCIISLVKDLGLWRDQKEDKTNHF